MNTLKNLWKFVEKNLIMIFLVCIVLYIIFKPTLVENFDESSIDLGVLNNALQSVIYCRDQECLDDQIQNFLEFKDQLGYKNFDPLLFAELLNAREEGELTMDMIKEIIGEDEDYKKSFAK